MPTNSVEERILNKVFKTLSHAKQSISKSNLPKADKQRLYLLAKSLYTPPLQTGPLGTPIPTRVNIPNTNINPDLIRKMDFYLVAFQLFKITVKHKLPSIDHAFKELKETIDEKMNWGTDERFK